MADADKTVARMGFYPMVTGERVEIFQAGAIAVTAKGDMTLTQGGAQMVRVAGDMSVREGGVQTLLAKGDVSVTEGGVLVGAARSIRVDNGMIGVAIGQNVEITDSRILFAQRDAIVFGAVAGVVMAVMSRLFRR